MLDKDFKCKIIDFGFATELKGEKKSGFINEDLGTIGYKAPEIMNKNKYQGEAVDLFALGVILFLFRTGDGYF